MATSSQVEQAKVIPNYYQLEGDGIRIKYSPDAGPVTPSGKGYFSYQDKLRALTFHGDQIRRVETPDLGTIVTVTLLRTVDTGATVFSVLLPAVNLPGRLGASVPIHTDGITTVHHFSVIPAFSQGQQDDYRVTPLSGTASNVIVPL